ncbi:MAG TPA: GRP family sugar transporter [Fibrobacteraceae bacterium]|nr:GRP family sugar transporter [Fibrobacteraceae bacterium]
MEQLHGLIAVLVAIVAWGSYTVPLKQREDISPFWFQWWLSLGIGLSSLIFGAFRGFAAFSLWGIFAGLCWTFGAACSFLAVQKEGMSGASTRWMGVGILVSFSSGVFVLGERVSMALALPGVLLLLAGLLFVSQASADEIGIRCFGFLKYWRSLCAGVVFGAYLLPMRLAQVQSWDFVAPMGIGIFVGALVFLLILRPAPSPGFRWISLGCGLAWNLANVGSLVAVQVFGLAIGFPLTQLALLVSISWGVFHFGESPLPCQRRFLMLAAISLLAGAALLGFSAR